MSCSTLGPLWLDRFVHDDDVTLREGWNEAFFHPFLERGRVHRLVVGLLSHQTGKAQTRDHRNGLVMAVGNADPQPSPSPTAPAFARQIGGSPGFINEDKLSGIEI